MISPECLTVSFLLAHAQDWDSQDKTKRQMAVALYFLDKLALRAGHEKDEDEADTVGCCTLKVGDRAFHLCWIGVFRLPASVKSRVRVVARSVKTSR